MVFIIITRGEVVLSIWTEPKKETPDHSLRYRYHREVEVQLFIHSASTTFPFVGSHKPCGGLSQLLLGDGGLHPGQVAS